MCEAVLYDYLGQLRKSFFTHPTAKLPALASFERVKFVTWGRRELEQHINLPIGSTLLRDDILTGKYDWFSPKTVTLPVIKFLEKDRKGKHHWYEVIKGFYMQGMLLSDSNEYRVYVVTIRTITPNADYNFWPRLLCNPTLEISNNISPY